MKEDIDYTNCSVLIVDDIPENLQLLGNILLNNDLDVGFATNGYEALENVALNKPDLILLDIMMPGMSGITVCEKLKENPDTRDIPVIFLTAKAQSEDIIKGFETGAVDYVTKPFNASELVARVMTHLELKKSRDLINAQKNQLADLNATKDKFFSIISHDLRGPYSGLIGLSEMIIEDLGVVDIEEVRDLTRRMHETIKHQYTLLDNLLQWARMQTGRMEFNPYMFSMDQLADDIIKNLSAMADNKSITLENHLSNLTITADKLMIRTVLHNLITNAIKFTPNNGKIIIDTLHSDRNITINVKDNGIGLKDEVIAKLFRLDTHHTSLGTNKEKGTGLGLLICNEMIELHGGKMQAMNNPDSGACFSFTIPNNIEIRNS